MAESKRDLGHVLLEAQRNAFVLFSTAKSRGLICAGKSERDLNNELYDLAFELYGI